MDSEWGVGWGESTCEMFLGWKVGGWREICC